MSNEKLHFGHAAKVLLQDLAQMPKNDQLTKTLVRVDGLKYRHHVFGILVTRVDEGVFVSLITYCSKVFCSYSVKTKCCLLTTCENLQLNQSEWTEEVTWDAEQTIRPHGLAIREPDMATLLATNKDSVIELCFLIQICSASPTFLEPPVVNDYSQGSDDSVPLQCLDGVIYSSKLLLMSESDYCRVVLTSKVWSDSSCSSIHCDTESVHEMTIFLFYLQTQTFYQIALFDTFKLLARIADKYGVLVILRQCSLFVNHCLKLGSQNADKPADKVNKSERNEDSPQHEQGQPEAVAASADKVNVRSIIRFLPNDLVGMWITCYKHLHDRSLPHAVMNLIKQNLSIAQIKNCPDYASLSVSEKEDFLEQFTCDECNK